MESAQKLFPAFLLLVLLLASSAMGPVASAEASLCQIPSKNFKGICITADNCATICRAEGKLDGKCHGIRRRCLCSAAC